jgi:subtilisin family serine protease
MKKRWSLLLALSVVVSICSSIPLEAAHSVKIPGIEKSAEEKVHNRKRPNQHKFNQKENRAKRKIELASKTNGEEAAALLNELDQGSELYKYSLQSTLEEYYRDPTAYKEELDELTGKLSADTGQEILAEFEDAQQERSRADELDYSTESVIVTFEPETEPDYIAEVADEQFGELDSTNITEDVDISEMSAKKREQIQEVSELEADVVASVDISLGQTVEQAVEMYAQYENVKSVQPDYLMEPEGLTADTHSGEQWYLNHINIAPGWEALSPGAMRETYIAVIDTGIQTSHPDLKNVYLKNTSVDITISGYPRLCDLGTKSYSPSTIGAHGTWVSGVVAAEANNGKGISGVATGADPSAFRLMAIKGVLNSNTAGMMLESNMIKAIYYAVDHGADVINISYEMHADSIALQDAIQYAYEANVPIVKAAGNENKKIVTSGIYYSGNLITVAGVTKENKKYATSNYGDAVTIAAPGTNIWTTNLNSEYCKRLGGTSYAAPIVAGVIANMKAITLGEITSDQILNILNKSASPLAVTNLGAGVVDGGLAIQMAKNLILKNQTEYLESVAATTAKQSIRLKWDTTASCANGYTIYRATSKNGEYTKVKTVTTYYTNVFTNTGLTSGKKYYYKIRGFIRYGEGFKYSKWSAIKSAIAK